LAAGGGPNAWTGKHRAMRDIDAALSKQLDNLPTGQRVGAVPTHYDQDDVGRPAITATCGSGVELNVRRHAWQA
jgi:hypothetical protein